MLPFIFVAWLSFFVFHKYGSFTSTGEVGELIFLSDEDHSVIMQTILKSITSVYSCKMEDKGYFSFEPNPCKDMRQRWAEKRCVAAQSLVIVHFYTVHAVSHTVSLISNMHHSHFSSFNYLDCLSPDLTRSLRMWKVSGFDQGQLRMVSFSQSSFTISSSPMSTSVVSKKEMVVLVFKVGLRGWIKHTHAQTS